MNTIELYIENQRVDLFLDEIIRIESSVQNVRDIGTTFDDYSQSFTVPASPRNNKIFHYWYQAWVDGFDGRIRHAAYINFEGMRFKTGSVLLEGCKLIKGSPDNYKLTFYGLLIDLKRSIGDALLSDLDLSAYSFDFSYDNVSTGLTTGLLSGNMVFPLISTKRQWLYNSDSGVTTYTDNLSNIAANGSGADHGIEWSSLRPAIKIMRIIEEIEDYAGIELSRDFLGSGPTENLRLWLANKDGDESLIRYTRIINYQLIDTYNPTYGTFDNSKGSFTPNAAGVSAIREVDISTESSDGVQYTLQLMQGTNVLAEDEGTGNLQVVYDLNGQVLEGVELYMRIVTLADKTLTDLDFVIEIGVSPFDAEILNVDKDTFIITSNQLEASTLAPNIKILDFLKGIVNMYNLVVLPTSATTFDVKTLDEWYEEGNAYDISKYVDQEEISVDRPQIYREISFLYEEPSTILAEQFAETNAASYGDLSTKILAADGSTLDGEEYEIELPFEQMVYEKLNDLDDDSTTNIVYGASLDSSLSPTFPKAHLLYTIQRDVSSNPIHLIDESGDANVINTTAFMPAHTESDSKLYSTAFGAEINEHDNTTIVNSLFKTYYQDYITDTFSIARRMFKLRCKLPGWLIQLLKLNDKLLIANERYVINSMVTEINTGWVDFELMNDIFNLAPTAIIEEEEVPETPPPPPPPITGDSFSISSTGGETQLGGCSQVANATKYSGTVPPNLGTFIYNDMALSSPYNGGDQYYKIADGKVIRINPSGIVTDVFTCP